MRLETFGAYFWGGFYAPGINSSLASGLRKLQHAGFVSTARIAVSPRLRNPGPENAYHFDLEEWYRECPLDRPFLSQAIRADYYQRALNVPGLKTIILTAYDSARAGHMGWDNKNLQPDWLRNADNARAVKDEYKDLTLAIYATRRDTSKRFIISNWETDNNIYCGSAYDYITQDKARI